VQRNARKQGCEQGKDCLYCPGFIFPEHKLYQPSAVKKACRNKVKASEQKISLRKEGQSACKQAACKGKHKVDGAAACKDKSVLGKGIELPRRGEAYTAAVKRQLCRLAAAYQHSGDMPELVQAAAAKHNKYFSRLVPAEQAGQRDDRKKRKAKSDPYTLKFPDKQKHHP
jgi:hypothetical protein